LTQKGIWTQDHKQIIHHQKIVFYVKQNCIYLRKRTFVSNVIIFFCGDCTDHQLQIPKYGHTQPVRYCSNCFIEVCVDLDDQISIVKINLKTLRQFCHIKRISIEDCLDSRDISSKICNHIKPPITNLTISTSAPAQIHQINRMEESESSNSNSFTESKSSYSFGTNAKTTNDYLRSKPTNKDITLDDLSVSQLKLILANNGVDFSDCFEKLELLQKIDSFCPQVRENPISNKVFEVPDKDQCIVCMERRIDCVLLECGHLAVCFVCGKHLTECPICRNKIERVVHTFHVNK